MRVMTLLIIHQSPKVLLAMKKRGFGIGRWNGFGGKVKEGETIEETMHRELMEESGGLTVPNLEKRALFRFHFPHNPEIDCETHVFLATEFVGEPQETEEMQPQWFDESEIPFDQMWSDDRLWLPLFLAGKKLKGNFIFDGQDKIVEHSLDEVEEII